jgi:hypothetical protein
MFTVCVPHVCDSLDRLPTLPLNVVVLGTVVPSPAGVGLNLDDKG